VWSTDTNQHKTAIAELLLQHGAERTPRWAVAMGEANWLRARHAEGKLVNPPDGEGLLSIAVRHGRAEIVKLLLDLGFDPDERIRVGGLEEVVYSWGRPLQLCAAANQLAMAQLMLDHGADPNGEIYAAGTPVSTAYRARDEAMLKLLCDHGGVIQAATAGYHRDTKLARRMLVDEAAGRLPPGTVPPGSSVAEQLLDGDLGDPEIVRIALDRIDWPRDDPRWYGRLTGPLAFWNHIPWIESEKWPFERGAYLTCLRLILARCHANVSGTYGRTILHDVVAMGRREGVRDWITEDEVVAFATVLLDAGARLDVRDDLLKSTPLGWACRWGRAKLVKLMLERGADPLESDAEPWARPRAWAEKLGHQAVLEALGESP
jgi:ankyrin repeat protein